ncbi:proline reductase cluster protein PrdD [Vagococcus acidifermentans]|uniref:Proline reductase cluster protein PrdD n=1 Tax=Vagococcus acidifermentans TaxID=564710 RepID=A0A430B2E1_9ENTE|nr:proline reductase cluster protein PrdD [Vagococcus acidifermentans]
MGEKVLKIKAFHMQDVTIGESTVLAPDKLQIAGHAEIKYDDIKEVSIQLLRPHHHDVVTNTIMDVIPISTKVLGRLGDGVTHTLTGVTVVMTGAIENGEQMHSFGASDGILSEHLKLNQIGTPDENDIIIHIDLLAHEDAVFNRQLCMKMFEVVDDYLQAIRDQLKMLVGNEATEVHEFVEKSNEGKPNVALIKQVAGQGAMYDTLLFPNEPSGFAGGVSIIDMNNMPVILSANEYRDGAIRAMV